MILDTDISINITTRCKSLGNPTKSRWLSALSFVVVSSAICVDAGKDLQRTSKIEYRQSYGTMPVGEVRIGGIRKDISLL